MRMQDKKIRDFEKCNSKVKAFTNDSSEVKV
jgi:hypothetical protein